MNTMIDLSVIIVSFNTKQLTKQTIDSVIHTTKGISYEIFVVDNASQDGSPESIESEYPNVRIIKNKENLGFSKANNMAIRQARGRYVLLLNSDTVVLGNCLENSVRYMDEHQDTGILGCKVVLQSGKLDHACKRGFPTPAAALYYMLRLDKLYPSSTTFGKYDLTYLSEDETNEVDCVTGAYMMVRRETFTQCGLLDEDYFMYGEDIDWCYRIKTAGWKVIYYPKEKIIHYKGESGKKRRYRTIVAFHKAMIIFYKKHFRKKYSFVLRWLVYTGIVLKLCLSLLTNFLKKKK